MRDRLTALAPAAFRGGLLGAVALCLLLPAVVTHAQDQKQVLVLYSNRRDAQIVAVGDRELPRILGAAHPDGVDYYSEVIDQIRLSKTDYVGAFRDFLTLKYGSHKFDVVIAMDDSTISGNTGRVFLDAGLAAAAA
jgi:hypothetical protein